MTTEDLQTACVDWQERLRLRDWDVAVEIVPTYKIKHDTCGACNATLNLKKALIQVLDPEHEYPSPHWPSDPEQTLVHELLHLHFEPFMAEDGEPYHTEQEQAIDLIACALVNLKRQAAKEDGNG